MIYVIADLLILNDYCRWIKEFEDETDESWFLSLRDTKINISIHIITGEIIRCLQWRAIRKSDIRYISIDICGVPIT